MPGERVFYPTTSPHFAVSDGDVLPTKGIGVGTKAFKYPSGQLYIWTGAEWITDESSLSRAMYNTMQEMLLEIRAIRLGSDLITNHDLRKG